MAETSSDLTNVLANCLENIEAGQLTVEECLRQYPQHAAELQQLFASTEVLRNAPKIQPSIAFQQQARRRLMAQLRPMPVEKTTIFEALIYKWRSITAFPLTRRFNMAWMLVFVAVASVLLGGGAAYAADDAVPGDLLYTLDRSIEEIQADLTRNPEAKVEMQIALIEERLSEVQELTSEAESADFQEALDGHKEAVVALAKTVGSTREVGEEVLELLDEALLVHETSLTLVPAPEEGEDEQGLTVVDSNSGKDTGNPFCTSDPSENPHPMAQRLEQQYGESAEQITTWFCGDTVAGTPGFGFGQILLALHTASLLAPEVEGPSTEVVDALLARRAAGEGWGQIWQDPVLDLGGPADVVPPVNPGPPPGIEPGPPPDVEPGPPPGIEPGPPPDVAPGPPPGIEPGPPPDVAPGPPPGIEPGPPPGVEPGPPPGVDPGPPPGVEPGPPPGVDPGPPQGGGSPNGAGRPSSPR